MDAGISRPSRGRAGTQAQSSGFCDLTGLNAFGADINLSNTPFFNNGTDSLKVRVEDSFV